MCNRSVLPWLFGLVVTGASAGIVSSDVLQPVAMSQYDDNLYVLDATGELYRSRSRSDIRHFSAIARIPATHRGIEVAAVEVSGRENVFVLSAGTTSSDSSSRLSVFSRDGQLLAFWPLPDRCTGMDGIVGSERTTLFFADATGKIYRMLVPYRIAGAKPPRVQPIAQVKIGRIGRLGPLTVMDSRYLLVAEMVSGQLFRVDYTQGLVMAVARGLGQPVSLLYNRKRGVLYSLDAISRNIYLVDNRGAVMAPPRVFTSGEFFRNPTTISGSADHEFLVGDSKARRIFAVSFTGKVQ